MDRRRSPVDRDERLWTAVDAVVAEGERSRNKILSEVVERKRIDAAFAQMAEDAENQAEMERIERELSSSSDAAWRHLDLAQQRRDRF